MTHQNSQGEHYLILKNHHFLTETLSPDQLPAFKAMTDKIASLLDYHQKYPRNSTPSLAERLKESLKVVEGSGGQDLLTKTFRKLAIVHIFLHKTAEGGYLSEPLADAALAAVQAIQEKDLKSLTKSRGGVFREIGQLLQNLSNTSQTPLPIQQQPSRGVIRELVEKIFRPFCLYLQRLIQDR